MIVLGIEGTAHTLGIGILDDKKILANVIKMFVPKEGGIHPREAAIHHSEEFIPALNEALEKANLSLKEIDLVSFSKGPGLGPCLRTVATAARTISLRLNIPVIGVNHSIAHLEIGKMTTGAEDPIMTYLSGGNTQIISYSNGRYRVFGETLDIGIGNLLDKFARELGIPFPGGPKIEELARKGTKFYQLPYSIKGMDVSFSGILTAILSYSKNGASIEDLSYSLQETVFAMMAEVTERALAHLNKDEVLLAGGVARNKRLKEMFEEMGKDRGTKIYVPPPDLCVDNGVMIGYLGKIMHESGIRMSIEDTIVDQKFRADSIDASWVNEKIHYRDYKEFPGAEAKIEDSNYLGFETIKKIRIRKSYRINDLDLMLRKERTKKESKLLNEVKRFGILVPYILDIDMNDFIIEIEKVNGQVLKKIYDSLNETDRENICKEIGRSIGLMHKNKMSHGDLTTSNIILKEKKLYFIDFSMGEIDASIEDMGTDLHLLKESFKSAHSQHLIDFNIILNEYTKINPNADEIIERLSDIEKRRRYS
ncbi:MAG: bifunctional N(6)-L-threonylcarbamoyladenine synthase/serine/threonine protein kinase [Thermoplasmata archaeon]|nr:bifunctional N(6)-L-threonylcarbamoyladenine synthase/serine/threonine protein kinase [Thermoplasmata archaeon]